MFAELESNFQASGGGTPVGEHETQADSDRALYQHRTYPRPIPCIALVPSREPQYGRRTEVYSCTVIQDGVVPGA